jgi:BirA family biotin operon repressor/biotin-[acetyl-CoA-carboxylase] ligase
MKRPFSPTLIRREIVESTSDLAREMVTAGGVDLPFVVWARRQTRGRGRGSNRWWSDAGSLTFTAAIDPAAHGLRPDHEPRLALAAAVAVIDVLLPLRLTASLGIRWPNDIEAGGRKLGGILPERVETASGVRLLIGIGLNVATQIGEAPAEIRRMAVSLAELQGSAAPRCETERLLEAVLSGFGAAIDRLSQDDPQLAARWAALDTLGNESVQVDLGPRIISGLGRGIDAEGALCLATERGPVRLFGGRVLRP